MSTSPLFFDPVVLQHTAEHRFLDIGCGHGKWGYLLRKYSDPSKQPRHITGIDLYEPHLESLRKENIYDELVHGSATELPFDDNSFDTVIACEIIEHLQPGEGEALMRELKRVATQCIIVSTPNFDCLRGGGETLDGFNPHEAHHHIYSYNEFKALGFTQVVGLGNLKIRPWRLGISLSAVGLFYPRWSRYLMGFWFADGKKRVFAYS